MNSHPKRGERLIIGCFPLYPPVELIHSLGMTPVVMWGLDSASAPTKESDQHLQAFTCSIARRLTEFVLSEEGRVLDGLVSYNACDTLRNLPEILQAGLRQRGRELSWAHFHVPMAPRGQTDSSEYLRNEIHSLIGALEQQAGRSFSADSFRESVELHRRARSLARILEAPLADGRVSFAHWAAALQRTHSLPVEEQILELEGLVQRTASTGGDSLRRNTTARIVVTGIEPPAPELSALIDQAGLAVVGNDMASMARTYGYMPADSSDPGDYYVDFYANHKACTTLLHTADRRIEAVVDLVKERGADGLILFGTKYCEYEYFEFPLLEDRLRDEGVAALALDFAVGSVQNQAAFQTRIEAFAEMLGNQSHNG